MTLRAYQDVVELPKQAEESLKEESVEFAVENLSDKQIPIFSKEVPQYSRRKETHDSVMLKYYWKPLEKASEIDSIQVEHLVFRKGENLDNFSKANVRDGQDSISVKYDGATYFLRKTNEDVAKALYAAAAKIKGAVESIIGYLRTLLGNFYIIASVERGSWVFDQKLACDQINKVELSKFDEVHMQRLFGLIAEKLTLLHKQRLVLGKFSLNNLLITTRELVFTDLRKLRVSRKSALFVEEYINAVRYLLANGIGNSIEASYATMNYAVENEDSCRRWYLEKTGRNAENENEIFEALEKEIEK